MASSTASFSSSSSEEEDYDRTGRALLKKTGFDPENISKVFRVRLSWSPTPLMYFIKQGNLKMVRYLITIRSADCRKVDKDGIFPLFSAAAYGHLEIVQFLYHECGAHNDIRKQNTGGNFSPLRIALIRGLFNIVYWLIRNGALSSPRDDVAGGGIDDMVMRRDLRQCIFWKDDIRLPILAWVRDAVATHDNVKVFLTGTIVSTSLFRRHPKNPYVTRSKKPKVAPSPLVLLKGKSGILELIAHYVAGTPQQRRTLRQLMDRLPVFIADVPFVVEEEEDEDDEDDY